LSFVLETSSLHVIIFHASSEILPYLLESWSTVLQGVLLIAILVLLGF
jgi:hypothetical protein